MPRARAGKGIYDLEWTRAEGLLVGGDGLEPPTLSV